MSKNLPRKQRQKISPIREGIAIHKEITKINPFTNFSSTPASFKLQKKKISDSIELYNKRARCKDLLQVTGSLLNLLEQTLINQSYAVLLTDKDGYIVEFRSDAETYHAYENNEIDLGFLYSREASSVSDPWNNSTQVPVIVGEVEHYTLNINDWTCCGVPIRDTEENFIGLLEVAVPNKALPPHTLAILLCACRTIEHELYELEKINKSSSKMKKLNQWILNSFQKAIFALDENFNILYLNDFGLNFIGLPEEAVTDHCFFEILPLEHEIKKWLEDILLGKSNISDREVSLLFQEKMLNLTINASELKNDEGKLIGLLLVFN